MLKHVMTAFAVGGLLMLSSAAVAADDEVAVGKVAPDFELKGSDGKTYKLSKLTEDQMVVLAWYPKAFTGG